jgi:hypothetical protein
LTEIFAIPVRRWRAFVPFVDGIDFGGSHGCVGSLGDYCCGHKDGSEVPLFLWGITLLSRTQMSRPVDREDAGGRILRSHRPACPRRSRFLAGSGG